MIKPFCFNLNSKKLNENYKAYKPKPTEINKNINLIDLKININFKQYISKKISMRKFLL